MNIEDFDVQIEFDYYNNDYDDVNTQEEEIREETDILFE